MATRIPIKLKTKQIRNMIRRKMLSLTIPSTSPCCQQCCGGCDGVTCNCCGIAGDISATVTSDEPYLNGVTSTLSWTGSDWSGSFTLNDCDAGGSINLGCTDGVWSAFITNETSASVDSVNCSVFSASSSHSVSTPGGWCDFTTANVTIDFSATPSSQYEECCACCAAPDLIYATMTGGNTPPFGTNPHFADGSPVALFENPEGSGIWEFAGDTGSYLDENDELQQGGYFYIDYNCNTQYGEFCYLPYDEFGARPDLEWCATGTGSVGSGQTLILTNVEHDFTLTLSCGNESCACSLPLFFGLGGCMITFEETSPGVFLADATHGFIAYGDPQGTYTITYDCNTCDGSIVYDGFYGNINETGNTCIDAGGAVALTFTLGTISCS